MIWPSATAAPKDAEVEPSHVAEFNRQQAVIHEHGSRLNILEKSIMANGVQVLEQRVQRLEECLQRYLEGHSKTIRSTADALSFVRELDQELLDVVQAPVTDFMVDDRHAVAAPQISMPELPQDPHRQEHEGQSQSVSFANGVISPETDKPEVLAGTSQAVRAPSGVPSREPGCPITGMLGVGDGTCDSRSRATFNLTPTNSPYEIHGSLWDLVLFIGTANLGVGPSIFCTGLAFMNVIMQICFVLVVFNNFLSPDVDQDAVIAAKLFRLSISHDYRFVDSQTHTALARRLCSKDIHSMNLEIATTQRRMISDINEYLSIGTDKPSFLHFFDGRLMCMLALLCWTITVVQEARENVRFAGAVYMLPCDRGEVTKLACMTTDLETERFSFKNVGFSHKVGMIVVCLIRTIICLTLLFAGCWWLAGTSNVRDLLLNAMALEFVMSLDELVYEALAPEGARTLVECFEALEGVTMMKIGHVELRTWISFMVVPAMPFFIFWVRTMPMLNDMREVKRWLCQEPLDFAYGIDQFHLVQVHPTVGDETYAEVASTALMEVFTKGSLDNLTRSNDPRDWKLDIQSAIALADRHLVDKYNPYCEDLLKDVSSLTPLQQHVNLVWGPNTCETAANECRSMNKANGLMTRALCPATCGCARYDDDGPFHTLDYGCPTACKRKPGWVNFLQTRPCLNMNVAELKASSFWLTWTQYLTEAKEGWLGEALLSKGCDFIQVVTAEEIKTQMTKTICKGTMENGLKPLEAVCPELCRCAANRGTLEECVYGPDSCASPVVNVPSS